MISESKGAFCLLCEQINEVYRVQQESTAAPVGFPADGDSIIL